MTKPLLPSTDEELYMSVFVSLSQEDGMQGADVATLRAATFSSIVATLKWLMQNVPETTEPMRAAGLSI